MGAFTVTSLTKSYGDQKGVFDFYLHLEESDKILILGPNGAGKTTVIRGMLGLTSIDSGSVKYDGEDIKTASNAFMMHVGAMVSTPAYYEYMSGEDNLKLYASVYKKVDSHRIHEVLDLVGLMEVKNKKLATYSTGMKQRLDFARAILHQPKLLILDEPFNGMDIEQKVKLKQYLVERGREGNHPLIVSSHTPEDYRSIVNRILILYEGKCLYEGFVDEIIQSGKTLEEHYIHTINSYKKERTDHRKETGYELV